MLDFASNISKPTASTRAAYYYALSIGAFDADKVSYSDFEHCGDGPMRNLHNSIFEALHWIYKEGFIVVTSGDSACEMVKWNTEEYPI